MPQTSIPPVRPPSKGGNLKYLVTGLLLLSGALGLWLFLEPDRPEPPSPKPQAPEPPERTNPLAQQNFVLEEPEEPEPEQPEPAVKAKRPRAPRRGSWECSGDLPTSKVRQVMAENRTQVRTCYERRLKTNHVLQGDLKLRVKVGSKGRVVATMASGSLRDNQVFSCVRSLADNWAFPVPTGGDCAVVQVPFHFTPRKD